MLKKDEKIKLFGIEYNVNESYEGYFLNASSHDNDKIFELLKINKEDLLKKFYNNFGVSSFEGDFPEFDTLENLTLFIDFIYTEVSIPTKDWKGKVNILEEGLIPINGYKFSTFNNKVYLWKIQDQLE